jgi:serine/threonine protein kinase
MSEDTPAGALPSYEIGDDLGRGAMREVFAGRHKRVDRDVAIKQLPPAAAVSASTCRLRNTRRRLLTRGWTSSVLAQ